MELFSLMGTVAINKDPALKDLKDIQDQAQKTATAMGGSFEKVGKFITDNSAKIKAIGKAITIAGGIITAAFTAIIYKTVEFEDELGDMSQRTGETVENLSALSYVAKMSETNIETLELSLKFLTRAIYDTSKGTGTAKDTFKELDISVVDTEGKLRPMIDVLKDAATKIAAIKDPTKQAALAMELFGARTGPQLLPMLKMGGAGIDELMRKAKELGLVLSTEDAEAADKFDKSMITLKESLAATGRDIAHVLMPPLMEFMGKVTEITKKVRAWMEENPQLTKTLTFLVAGLGGVMLVLGPMIAMLPSLVAGFNLVIPAVAAVSTTLLSFASAGVWGLMIIAVIAFVEAYKANFLGLKTFTDKVVGWVVDKYEWYIEKTNAFFGQLSKTEKAAAKASIEFGLSLQKIAGTDYTESFTDLASAYALVNKTGGEASLTTETLNKNIKALSENFERSQKYVTDNNKSVKDSIRYYNEMITAMTQLNSQLNGELSLIPKGTEEYKKKEAEIEENTKGLKDYRVALDNAFAPLEGLDLIAAKMNLLGDSAIENKIKLGYLAEEAVILKGKLLEAVPTTENWNNLNQQIVDNIEKMKSLNESIRATELSTLEAKLGYVRSKFEEGKPSVEGYKLVLGILGAQLVVLEGQLEAATPDTPAYWDLVTAVEECKDKIKLVNDALKEAPSIKESTVKALSEMGIGFTGLTTDVKGLREELERAADEEERMLLLAKQVVALAAATRKSVV